MRRLPADAVETACARALAAIEQERAGHAVAHVSRGSGLPGAAEAARQPAFDTLARKLDAERRPIERLRDLALWYRGRTIPVDDATFARVHAHYPLAAVS